MKRAIPIFICILLLLTNLTSCMLKPENGQTEQEGGDGVTAWPLLHEAWRDYFFSIEQSGDYVVVKDGRCYGYDMLRDFYERVSTGSAAQLKYTVAEYGEPIKREGHVVCFDKSKERRRIGLLEFDGEKFYDSGTDYFPVKQEYYFEAPLLKLGLEEIPADEGFERGYDRTECYFLAKNEGIDCIYTESKNEKQFFSTEVRPEQTSANDFHPILAFKTGWGEEKHLSAEVMRYETGSDIPNLVERLKAEGFVIEDSKKGVTGYDRLVEFYEKTSRGEKDTLKYAAYYPAGSDSNENDSLFIHVVNYNGEFYTKITRDIDSNAIDPPSYWRYLKRETVKMRDGARHDTAEHFYFVDDRRNNWEDIERAMVSSDSRIAFGFAWGVMITVYYD